jgi:hypothetical protein
VTTRLDRPASASRPGSARQWGGIASVMSGWSGFIRTGGRGPGQEREPSYRADHERPHHEQCDPDRVRQPPAFRALPWPWPGHRHPQRATVTPPGAVPRQSSPVVDAARLWAGGAATAVVAGLVAVVGVLLAEGVLNVTMVHPPLLPIGESFPVRYALTAALLALVATAVGHVIAVTTPRPRAFFGWLVGLVTAAACVLPFALEGSFGGQLATSLVNLVIGVSILSLLSSVLVRTVRVPGPAHPRAGI